MIVHHISPHSSGDGWVGKPRKHSVDAWKQQFPTPAFNGSTVPAALKSPYQVMVPLGDKGAKVLTTISKTCSKLVYALWLGTLKYQRGDYVVNESAMEPLGPHNYLRVLGYQEVHFLCDFDHKDRAMCLDLLSSTGTRFFSIPSGWEVVDPPKPEWQFDLVT